MSRRRKNKNDSRKILDTRTIHCYTEEDGEIKPVEVSLSEAALCYFGFGEQLYLKVNGELKHLLMRDIVEKLSVFAYDEPSSKSYRSRIIYMALLQKDAPQMAEELRNTINRMIKEGV